MIGKQIGSYRVESKLGEGGMGEVYRARDTALNRDAAIKVLPDAFALDADRLTRFTREAQTLAALNHPNIATIYGIEASGGTRALAMELVDGEDLSLRLARGPIPLDDALPIARQIADALEAAHEAGIVHRDLKPANVKVRPDGTVKVLDFGLAKAMEPAGAASADPMNSPTMAASGTQAGLVLGTAGYMAPEQARGAAVDGRADIWAFGVVCYEMLTGHRLFPGDSVAETLAGVLKTEIDFDALPSTAPPELRRLLGRCLQRNPKHRLHDIADARIALEEIASGEDVDVTPTARPVAVDPPARGRWTLPATAIVMLLVGVAAGWLAHRPAAPSPGADARWALAIPDGFTLSLGGSPNLAISDDGRLQAAIVFDRNSQSHVLVRSATRFDPEVLPDTEGAVCPFFSPDARWLAFIRDRALVKMPVAGGPEVEVARFPGTLTARGATWSRDGYMYFSPNTTAGLFRVPEGGGEATPVTVLDTRRKERTHRWPQALPDGSAVIFTNDSLASTEYYDDARIEAVRPGTGERRVLIEGASQARYGTGGHLVFARGGVLFAAPFDPRTLAVTGTPRPIVDGVATDVATGAVQFALSPSGAALWAPGPRNEGYRLAWVARDGTETGVPVPQAPYNEVALSRDGRWAALVGGVGGAGDLWVSDLERGTQTRLTSGQSVGSPTWTPDGTRVAYVVRSGDPGNERSWRIAWRRADGSTEAETLFAGPNGIFLGTFTPDGSGLLFCENKDPGTGAGLLLLTIGSTASPRVVLRGDDEMLDATVSPDGRWLAYSSTEGSRTQAVFVRPFPSGEGRWQVSSGIGYEPRWSHDGREIFYRAGPQLMRVAIDTTRGFSAGTPTLLLDRVAAAAAVHSYGVSPDGTRFFTARTPEGLGSQRTVYLDLSFAQTIQRPSEGQQR